MGRIVATFFTSLDGVVESPNEWQGDAGSPAMAAVITAGNEASEAFLMGRTLYDEWAAHWPRVADDQDFYAGYINHVAKYVVSSSLRDPEWAGTTVLGSLDEVRGLKERLSGDIAMFGSTSTVRELLGEGLVDELCLLVHPVAVGHGVRLFEGTGGRFELVSAEAIDKGVVVQRYRPVG